MRSVHFISILLVSLGFAGNICTMELSPNSKKKRKNENQKMDRYKNKKAKEDAEKNLAKEDAEKNLVKEDAEKNLDTDNNDNITMPSSNILINNESIRATLANIKKINKQVGNNPQALQAFIEKHGYDPKKFTQIISPSDKNYLPKDIFEAIEARDLTAVGNFLEITDKSSLYNDKGENPLHIACLYGYNDIIKFLLEKGFSIDDDDCDSFPLHVAIHNGDVNTIQTLLSSKANDKNENSSNYLELDDNEGNTPLNAAIISDNFETEEIQLEIVKMLLNRSAKIEDIEDDSGTSLHLAATYGREKILKELLERGANIFCTDSEKQTPLHNAASSNHRGIIKILLEWKDKKSQKSIHIDSKNDKGQTALYSAIEGNHFDFDAGDELLRNGADIEAYDNKGRTPLHHSVETSSLNIMKELLNRSANINSQDSQGQTPLHKAFLLERTEMVIELLNTGADATIKNNTKQTPFQLAKEKTINALVKKITSSGQSEQISSEVPVLVNAIKSSGQSFEKISSENPVLLIKKISSEGPVPALVNVITSFDQSFEKISPEGAAHKKTKYGPLE